MCLGAPFKQIENSTQNISIPHVDKGAIRMEGKGFGKKKKGRGGDSFP
jgi:hypothetical protein